MNELLESLQDILVGNISSIERELQYFKKKHTAANIQLGSWLNQEFILAYTSINLNGDRAGDSIEFILQLAIQDNYFVFTADVAKTNGELISDILQEKVLFSSKEGIMEEVENLSRKAILVMKGRLNDLMLSQE